MFLVNLLDKDKVAQIAVNVVFLKPCVLGITCSVSSQCSRDGDQTSAEDPDTVKAGATVAPQSDHFALKHACRVAPRRELKLLQTHLRTGLAPRPQGAVEMR